MEFRDRAQALTEEDVKEAEDRLGLQLPRDLRDHYLRVNGGMPFPNSFILDGDYFKIQTFLPIKWSGEGLQLEDSADYLYSNNLVPRHFIPFAVDASGDYFLYDNRKHAGQIWFFQSDYHDDPVRALVFLAETFEDFLNSLQSDEI